MADTKLSLQQQASQRAYDRMLSALIQYQPAERLTMADAKFIAEWCRTCAFDALCDVAAAEVM